MKWLLDFIGVVLILIGIVWFLQGINILLGSFMSGDPLYAGLGILLVVVSMIIMAFTNRRNKGTSPKQIMKPDSQNIAGLLSTKFG